MIEKGKLEDAQRAMRKHEMARGITFSPKFFYNTDMKNKYALYEELAAVVGSRLAPEKTAEVWRIDREMVRDATRPYRGTSTLWGSPMV